MLYTCDICNHVYSTGTVGKFRCQACTHSEAGWRARIEQERLESLPKFVIPENYTFGDDAI